LRFHPFIGAGRREAAACDARDMHLRVSVSPWLFVFVFFVFFVSSWFRPA